jgi:hypothetical protein
MFNIVVFIFICFFILVHSASKEVTESKEQEEKPDSLVKYFSVVWCKASKKKHKKWEGDAILVVKGMSFTLKDLEGKDIGRGIVILPNIFDFIKNLYLSLVTQLKYNCAL